MASDNLNTRTPEHLNPQHSTANAAFAIHLLGPFDVQLAGKPLPPLRSVKGKYLLALLTLRHDTAVSRQWLAENLWPDSDTADPLGSLRQSLADLRRALGTEAYRLTSPTKTTLLLDITGANVDILRFDKAITRGDVESLRIAVEAYRGPLLEGVSEAWILGEREARQQAVVGALETLAAYARVDGDTANEIAWLRRLAACDPLRETACRNLMRALASAGEVQAALDVFLNFRRDLLENHNATPATETQTLFHTLRTQAQHTASSPALPASAPQTRLAAGNVPRPLTPLIGREQTLRDLKARILVSSLVTLVGTGGVGKTRLALQAAYDLAGTFQEGVWFIDLSGAGRPGQVTQEIAGALGIREEGGRSLRQTLADALRLRPLLLVLDNCETCLHESAELAQELLRACSHLRLLATSRQRLGLASEAAWPVEPLPLGEGNRNTIHNPQSAIANPEHLNTRTPEHPTPSSPAVELFVARAQAIRPGFVLTAENYDTLVEICRRLDGLPLALELAASLVDVLTLQEIAARLPQRFDLLQEPESHRPPRHQSLRAVIASSVELLAEEERLLLRRLSVFVGGWTLDAAEAIHKQGVRIQDSGVREEEKKRRRGEKEIEAIHNPQSAIANPEHLNTGRPLVDRTLEHQTPNTHPVFPSLRCLVAKSLVVAEEGKGQMRYRMLESIREYAGEMLRQSGEEAEWHGRHLTYYGEFARLAEAQLTGPQQAAWLERLENEAGNLRTALEWAENHAEYRRHGLELANALGRYWQIRGHFAEGRDRLARLLDFPQTQTAGALRANALNWVGLLSVFVGDFDRAQASCEQGYALWQQLHDNAGAAGSLGILGIVAANQGHYEEARRMYQQSLELSRAAGDTLSEAGTLGYLGIVAASQGYYGEARGCYETSLRLRRQFQDRWGIASSLNNLGQLARRMGDLEQAHDLLTETLAMRRELGDRRNIGISLNILGLLAWQRNDLPVAAAHFTEASRLFALLGDRRNIAYALEAWARCAVSAGDNKRAARLLGAAEALRQKLGSPLPKLEAQELARDTRPALAALGETETHTLKEQGKHLTPEQALHEAYETALLDAGETSISAH